MRFDLPYDRQTVAVEIDDRNFVGSLISKVESYRPDKSQQELVEASRRQSSGDSRWTGGNSPLDERNKARKWLSDPGCIAIPGGSETVQAAQQRVTQAIRDAASSFRGESVLIIGHKHVNALLMCALLKEPFANFGNHIIEDTVPHCLLLTP